MFLTNGYFSYACSGEYSETEFSKEFSINASVLLKESGASGVRSINDNGATFYSVPSYRGECCHSRGHSGYMRGYKNIFG